MELSSLSLPVTDLLPYVRQKTVSIKFVFGVVILTLSLFLWLNTEQGPQGSSVGAPVLDASPQSTQPSLSREHEVIIKAAKGAGQLLECLTER